LRNKIKIKILPEKEFIIKLIIITTQKVKEGIFG